MSTTEPEPEGPSIEAERSAEVTTEAGTEVQHAEQTEISKPVDPATGREVEEEAVETGGEEDAGA
jgi:hypothetical protein